MVCFFVLFCFRANQIRGEREGENKEWISDIVIKLIKFLALWKVKTRQSQVCKILQLHRLYSIRYSKH